MQLIYNLKHSFVLHSLVILFSLFTNPNLLYATETETANNTVQTTINEFDYQFKINTILYTGIYIGETANGIPNGFGTFVTNSDSPKQFTYEGDFQDGIFHGNGILTYSNGEYLESKFSNGLATSLGKLWHTDGSYSTIRHSKQGIPYALTLHYSSNETLQDYDFYYDGYLISDLISDAKIIDYRLLYENPDSYFGDILLIDCTVIAIHENASSCIFQVADENNNIYWGSYQNTAFQQYNQSIMPTLEIGDKLELYAYYCGISSCSSTNIGSFSTLPELVPIIGITDDTPIDRTNPSHDYANILKYPYNYYKVSTTLKGTVKEIFYNEDKSLLKLLATDQNYYYFSFDVSELESTPILNDYIKIKGTYKGLYKEYNTVTSDNAVLFPSLNATSIKIIN